MLKFQGKAVEPRKIHPINRVDRSSETPEERKVRIRDYARIRAQKIARKKLSAVDRIMRYGE